MSDTDEWEAYDFSRDDLAKVDKRTEALARVIDGAWDYSTDEDHEQAIWTAEKVLKSEWFAKELDAARSEGFERCRHRVALEVLRPANAVENPYRADQDGEQP